MVKTFRKDEASGFLRKAEEFQQSALDNYQRGRLSVCIFDSSQAIILANDALCISVLGRRASKDHKEAVQMHIDATKGQESKKEVVQEALDKRSEYGYTGKAAGEKEANKVLIRSKRFMEWVRERI